MVQVGRRVSEGKNRSRKDRSWIRRQDPERGQTRRRKEEVDSSKGMDSFDCNDSLCYEIEKVLAEDDEGL